MYEVKTQDELERQKGDMRDRDERMKQLQHDILDKNKQIRELKEQKEQVCFFGFWMVCLILKVEDYY